MVAIVYPGRSDTSMHEIVEIMASNKETISQNQMYLRVYLPYYILKNSQLNFTKVSKIVFRDIRKV